MQQIASAACPGPGARRNRNGQQGRGSRPGRRPTAAAARLHCPVDQTAREASSARPASARCPPLGEPLSAGGDVVHPATNAEHSTTEMSAGQMRIPTTASILPARPADNSSPAARSVPDRPWHLALTATTAICASCSARRDLGVLVSPPARSARSSTSCSQPIARASSDARSHQAHHDVGAHQRGRTARILQPSRQLQRCPRPCRDDVATFWPTLPLASAYRIARRSE